jgi:hypothetical protein
MVVADVIFDGTDVPPEFVAVIVNVYIVFGINPDTVIGEDVPVPVIPELLVRYNLLSFPFHHLVL